METAIRELGSVTVVELKGDLDTISSRELQQKVLAMVTDNVRLVLELSGVGYMSSAGLRLMLSLYRRVTSMGGRLVLVGVGAEILDTMDVTGSLEFFTACDSLEEALDILDVPMEKRV